MRKHMLALALVAGIVCSAFTGCGGIQTQRQKIATACEGAATAADTIAIGVGSGRITPSQAADALLVYRVTVPFCQPEPVAKLNDVDYAALINAAAQLATLSEKAR